MKFRIIGILFILVVLGALVILTEESSNKPNTPQVQQSDTDANALKGLKIQ